MTSFNFHSKQERSSYVLNLQVEKLSPKGPGSCSRDYWLSPYPTCPSFLSSIELNPPFLGGHYRLFPSLSHS